MRVLEYSSPDFNEKLDELLAWEAVSDEAVVSAVDEIVESVQHLGDSSVLAYTEQFDDLRMSSVTELEVSQERMAEARSKISPAQLEALEFAANRIRAYHEHQKADSWQYREADGTVLGQLVNPMQRVGIYVPGGKASYPSSVLMNAIPAKVAGVDEIIMTVPAPAGELSEMVLAAAAIAGVDRVFTIGGAQAIAALAFGTETIPRVDKIVGPGNIFVATAKRKVFGQVGLDMIAGPSEILVLCDGDTDPDWIAMDLFSQAEHDENAQSILIATSTDFIERVQRSIDALLETLPRRDIIERSLADRGAMILVDSIEQGIALSNRIAPEHLELSIADPEAVLPQIRNAGAVFMGRYTAEALGDYCAGPNHVLPTSGTARFSSPLGVYDFQKRSSIIYCSPAGASTLGKAAAVLADGESLQAHGRSALYRVQEDRVQEDRVNEDRVKEEQG